MRAAGNSQGIIPAMRSKISSILFFLALVIVGYLTFDWAVGAVIHQRKAVTVPDLTGKSVGEALELLSKAKLSLVKDTDQFDKRFPAGVIIRQNPDAGVGAREGRTVHVTLSQGGERLFVPDILGQPFRQAQTMLQNVGLGVGEIERRPSLRFEKDTVMTSDPPGRAVASKNALVSLVVSDGAPESSVLLAPDFVGRTIPDVKKWAAANQIIIAVKEDNDIARGAGEVLQQFPTPDSPIRPGETMNVVANGGGSDQAGKRRVLFDVPPGTHDRDVKVIVVDEAGEREVYRRSHSPGSRVDFPVEPKGRTRARIFINGIMVEEQELQ